MCNPWKYNKRHFHTEPRVKQKQRKKKHQNKKNWTSIDCHVATGKLGSPCQVGWDSMSRPRNFRQSVENLCDLDSKRWGISISLLITMNPYVSWVRWNRGLPQKQGAVTKHRHHLRVWWCRDLKIRRRLVSTTAGVYDLPMPTVQEISVVSETIRSSQKARNIGVIFNNHFLFNDHVASIQLFWERLSHKSVLEYATMSKGIMGTSGLSCLDWFQRERKKQHKYGYSCFPFLLAETPRTLIQ